MSKHIDIIQSDDFNGRDFKVYDNSVITGILE